MVGCCRLLADGAISRYLAAVRLLSYLTPGFPASLFEVLGDVVGVDVDFEQQLSGPAPGSDPFRDGSVDLGWICSTSYVDLATRGADPTVQLVGVAWVPDDPDVNGRPIYFGDLVTAPGSDITGIDDLRGKRVGCNDPVSLSGHYALRFALDDRGHDPDSFADLVFTGGHHRSLDLVLDGQLDAAVIDSVVRTGRARHDPGVAALPVVERLGPWPVQPLVARSTLDQEAIGEVRRLLLEAGDRADVRRELQGAALSHLVAVGSDHYAAVRSAMIRTG